MNLGVQLGHHRMPCTSISYTHKPVHADDSNHGYHSPATNDRPAPIDEQAEELHGVEMLLLLLFLLLCTASSQLDLQVCRHLQVLNLERSIANQACGGVAPMVHPVQGVCRNI